MRPAVVAVALAACIPPIQTFPIENTAKGEAVVRASPYEAARLVIAKLNARGFALVEQRTIDGGLVLVLSGNRDVSGIHTIGSVFYASIRGGGVASQVTLVGKPTLDHRESCPSITGDPCSSIVVYSKWGVNGYEEQLVIRGVFAELELDASPSS